MNSNLLFIYLLYSNGNFVTAGSARIKRQGKTSEKNEEKERDRGTQGETSYPTQPGGGGHSMHEGKKEENWKQKKSKKEERRSRPQPS